MAKEIVQIVPSDNDNKNAIEHILARAKEQYIQKCTDAARSKALSSWAAKEDIFRDYLNGLTMKELCAKYCKQRTYIFEMIREYNIPHINTDSAARLARKLAVARAIDTRLQAIHDCDCLVCNWMRKRICLIKQNKVE